MAFNPFEPTEKEKQFNPFEPEINDDDNVFEAAYHGLAGAAGNVIKTAGHMLNYEGKPAYMSDEEWARRQDGSTVFGINKAIENFGREMEEKHQRNYSEPLGANSIASGIGSVVPYAVALGLTARSGRAIDPAGLGEAAGVQLGQKVAPRFGQTAARITEAVVPGLALGQRQAFPEALIEMENAQEDYVENAKAQGKYKPGVTEAEAERISRSVLEGNLGFITGTDAAQNALINSIALGQGSRGRRALQAIGIGGGINAAQEIGQQIIPKEAKGEDWSFTDPDIVASGIIGGITGGLPSAVAAALDSRSRTADNFGENAVNDALNAGIAGAANGKEAFINAIAGQESGGDYNAVNGRTGAAGKYQIMPENWPAWAEEAGIGSDAEMTPENQEIVARFKLGQYYDKYGARDAAIAWYGGEGAINYSDEAKNRKQGNGNEPSINEYADSVMARMGAGVGRRDLRSMYADENDTAEVVVPEQRVIPARGFDTNIADEQAADSEQSTAYNEDEITRRIAERINENSSLTDEALDAIAGNRGAWTDGVSGVEFNDGSRRARTATVGRSAGTPASVSIATPALNRLRGGRQRTRTQANLNSSRQDYIDELNRRELNARIDQLNVENQQVEPPRANNSRLTALIRRARSGRTGSGSVENALRSNSLQRLTERAMSGDHSAERSFDGLRPDVRAALLGRHTARLEAQNREAEANVSREALRAAEAQQAERQQAQQQEILREAEQYFRESYSDPLQGVRRELRDARANVEKLLEPALNSLREGAGNGYSLVPGTEEGRMVRMSNNAPWYQEFRRTYGRKPNKGELVQIAREIYSGTNSYGVPGWERTQESEAEFARNREQLAELDEFINTYEQLEERFAAEQKNGGTNNGENALDNENNNQNSEPQESQQSGQTREEGKNAEAEKEITAPSEQDSKETETAKNKNRAPAKKAPKKPKADARFTAKGEKLIPQTAELRGNEITVVSKPAKNAANNERLIGVELPEGEYTITVDEWKEAGKFGNPNYRWHNLVREKYMDAFPNTVTASDGFRFMENPIHDRIIDNQITAIKQAVKAYDEAHATPEQTETNQQQAEPANRFDGSRAESALDKLIGRKQPKQQEQQTGKKFMNVFDESELEAEIAKAKAEMSKLSANPFFNPALMKSLFKIGGIYMQRGVNNFTGWSERMVETLGSKVRPFLKSAWDALQAYPSDVKFNDDIMTATLEFVGSRVDNGRSRDEIRNEFTEMYGDEYVAYVDAAYEGVNSYPTEIAENADVVEETATDENEEPAQEIQSVSGDARVMESGDSSGIPDIFSTSEESWLGPDGRKTYYDLRSPKGESFARRIPEEIQKKYGIVKQIPLMQLSFDSAEGRKRFANDWVEGKIEGAKRSVELANREAEEKREKEAAAARMRADLPEATFNLNEAQNGIEIKFTSKPSEEVRRGLKEARFRWSQPKQLWYAKQTPEAMAFAESIGYVPENMVQSNQETNEAPSVPAAEKATQQPAAQEREAVINGNDNDTGRHRAVSENLPAAEVQGTESERTTERVREPEVEGRGVQVTGDNGRAAGERPVSGERRPAGESAAQSGTGSNSEGTSERGSVRALRPAQKKKAKASEVPGHNFTITADENIGKGGAKTKYKDNVAAIKLLKQLEAEDRLATPEEQKVLARYVGWGGLAPVFSYGRDSAWESEKAELRELLTDEEYNAARGSTNNAHYTSPEVIKGVWDIIERLGFKGGKVLEPSMGIGNFFGMMPEKLRSKSSLNGVELDSLTGRIAKQLYQKASVEITGYEQTKYPDDYFDLAISNVPFGQFSLHDPKYNKFKFNIHNYFFAKAIDQVRPGGLVAFITSTGTMQSGSDAKRLRELLKNKADFIGAVRLPNTAFKENAGTEVTTDLIILQKR